MAVGDDFWKRVSVHNIIMESENIIITIDSDKQVANLKVQFVLVSIKRSTMV